jgi:hypothetical protein
VLRRVIKGAKRLHYNNLIKGSANKIKAKWNTIRKNVGQIKKLNGISEINSEAGFIVGSKELVCVFNDCFKQNICLTELL